MGNIRKYSAVIFDLDGTLLNTIDDLRNSLNEVLSAHGYKNITVDDAKHFLGNGASVFVGKSLPQGTNDDEFKRILDEFVDNYKDNCLNLTAPYDKVPEMIDELSKAGFKTAIVSNKPDVAVQMLKEMFFKNVDVAIGEREGTRKKPAPDMVISALEKLKVNKEDAVYVGDTEVDLMTAKNSGMDCISVGWGFRTKSELIDSGASVICDDVSSLEKLLTEKQRTL